MDLVKEVSVVLIATLGLKGRRAAFTRDTHLLGAIPELDSMAVVSIITALEERLSVVFDDDEFDGSTFATVGSLVDFVAEQLPA